MEVRVAGGREDGGQRRTKNGRRMDGMDPLNRGLLGSTVDNRPN